MVWLASDIHLGAHTPKTRAAFHRFLALASARADALLLCGDIFDAWIGDDVALRHPPDWLDETLDHLKNAAKATSLWLGRGNRDFLIGDGLTGFLGARRLPEACRLQTGFGDLLLSHGDEYCTDDKAYQRFRRVVHNPLVQGLFLSLNTQLRLKIAGLARRRSTSANRQKPKAIMDVSPQAIEQAFARSGLRTMVHGHTHRPAVHTLRVNAQECTRIVLPDWDYDGDPVRGGWLAIDADGPELVENPGLLDMPAG